MARGEQRVRGNDTWENGRREGRKDGRGEDGKAVDLYRLRYSLSCWLVISGETVPVACDQ